MSEDSQTGPAGLLGDDRARVPFAVIAVLLLVSAVAVVGYLETRGPAETDTDAALAMDRTDAAIQTALRDVTASAAMQAAEEPLTSPANTSYGDALDAERPFRSYLEALVYLEAAERFDETGQRVGDVRTAVSLPAVTDAETFEDALGRVAISETDEPGLLRVELDDIQITATRDGEQLASRTETVAVSVPTPVIQQHERTEEFQQRLDAPVTSTDPGFSHRFNTRMYILGWLRGYAQYGGVPVTEVIANRHVVPSANSAVYRTQQDVFGAADPNLRNAVNRGWFCMAAQDAEALYEGYSAGGVDVADDICEASEWVLGEKHTGELPDAPDTLDMFETVPGMDAEQTIGVNETAYSPLRALVAGSDTHSIEGALERAFTIETAIDPDIDVLGSPVFHHDRPHPDATVVDTGRSQENVSIDGGSVTRGEPAEDGTYYRFSNVGAAIEITEAKTWEWTANGSTERATTDASGTLEVAVTVRLAENETAPGMHIDEFNEDIGVDHEYERGPDAPADGRTVPAPGFRNYADSQDDIAGEIVGGTTLSAFGAWLADQWDDATRADALALPERESVTLDLDATQEAALVTTAVDDIAELQLAAENITHTFERTDLVHAGNETGPVGKLVETVRAEREAYLDREAAYENVGQLSVYEIRYAYFETLIRELLVLEEAHGEVMGELDGHLNEVDSGLDHALSFVQQGTDAAGLTGEPDAPPLASPEITPEITYEVSGSPTYLAGEAITTEEVPAVEQGTEFSPLAAKNANYLKLPYETIISGILDSLLDLVGLGSSDAELTLRTAGEALRAGELAADAAEADAEYADGGNLAALNAELRDALEEALYGFGGFSDGMGVELVSELYGVEPDYPGALGPPPYAGNETHSRAYEVTRDTAADTIAGYNSTAEAAIAVGAGNATDDLIVALSDALDDDELERPEYARSLTSDEWQAVVASAVRPALDRAAANATATLDGTAVVENLDTATRQALENVSMDIVEERLDSYVENGSFDLSEYDDWVGDGDDVDTPVRVPAGLPLLPLPTHWVATMNLWDIHADGEYARFEVEANMSAPGRATSTTYVRENTTVDREIAGETRRLGAVEPITFDGRSLLIVVVPPGGIGVGDRDDEDPECTETYPVTGQFHQENASCGFLGGGSVTP